MVEVIRSHPDKPLNVKVSRGDSTLNLTITPVAKLDDDGKTIGFIGAAAQRGLQVDRTLMATERYGPLQGLAKGGSKTLEMSVMTLQILGKMIKQRLGFSLKISVPLSF